MAVMSAVVQPTAAGLYELALLDRSGAEVAREALDFRALAHRAAELERANQPRWVFAETAGIYADLLAAGVRVQRAHDLRLVGAILALARPGSPWAQREVAPPLQPQAEDSLFGGDLSDDAHDLDAVLSEYQQQLEVLAGDEALRLLCTAESAGALIAVEMRVAGLPWDIDTHEQILQASLGERVVGGTTTTKMLEYADEVRAALGDANLNLDSQQRLLRALRRAGLDVRSTNRWELAEYSHPAIKPLLAYKHMHRMFTANGWNWMRDWVRDGRFRPVYIAGGVVTGRWASAGGGALQIARVLRPAVRADPGWQLIVADVAQLEPRMLAAISRDDRLAAAGRGRDLYSGIVESGAVQTRDEAKIGMLGAMYGGTTGESGRVAPQLRRAFPKAMAYVDGAAAAGERGERVRTFLGRTSPLPSAAWREAQREARTSSATAESERRARTVARDLGRFTRNFVVQGTAAEWALIWLAEIRHRLWLLGEAQPPAEASGPVFNSRPHLAFFLHDEIIVHTPAALAELAAHGVREAAAVATQRMFGAGTVDIPLDLKIASNAAKD